jgi:hypothetical protein
MQFMRMWEREVESLVFGDGVDNRILWWTDTWRAAAYDLLEIRVRYSNALEPTETVTIDRFCDTCDQVVEHMGTTLRREGGRFQSSGDAFRSFTPPLLQSFQSVLEICELVQCDRLTVAEARPVGGNAFG